MVKIKVVGVSVFLSGFKPNLQKLKFICSGCRNKLFTVCMNSFSVFAIKQQKKINLKEVRFVLPHGFTCFHAWMFGPHCFQTLYKTEHHCGEHMLGQSCPPYSIWEAKRSLNRSGASASFKGPRAFLRFDSMSQKVHNK